MKKLWLYIRIWWALKKVIWAAEKWLAILEKHEKYKGLHLP